VVKAGEKGTRSAQEGLVFSYIHPGGRLGVLVEVNCETDFVAKTEGFKELVHNLAIQIAATNPVSVSREQMPEELVKSEPRLDYIEQAKEIVSGLN